jgi:hypothetical protein
MVPGPDFEAVSVYVLDGGGGEVTGAGLKLAVTVTEELVANAHGPVPVHPPPDQPSNTEPLPAAALNVTSVPGATVMAHDEPQLMPAGELVTVPLPVPDFVTATVTLSAVEVAHTSSEYGDTDSSVHAKTR